MSGPSVTRIEARLRFRDPPRNRKRASLRLDGRVPPRGRFSWSPGFSRSSQARLKAGTPTTSVDRRDGVNYVCAADEMSHAGRRRRMRRLMYVLTLIAALACGALPAAAQQRVAPMEDPEPRDVEWDNHQPRRPTRNGGGSSTQKQTNNPFRSAYAIAMAGVGTGV